MTAALPSLASAAKTAVAAATAAQTAAAQLVTAAVEASPPMRCWDFIGVVPNAIPIYVAGFSSAAQWAKSVPAGVKFGIMDIECGAMNMGVATDNYGPGGRGASDVQFIANSLATAVAALPNVKIGVPASIPNNAAYNAGNPGSTEWVYGQMAACAPAFKQASFIAVECYLKEGQSAIDLQAQAGQWLGMAAEYGLPVMAIVQPYFAGSNNVPIPADVFGLIVRYVASLCRYGVCLWGNPDPQYKAGYAASPAVAWLASRVAKDGTLSLA